MCFETFNSSQFNLINDDSLEDKIISANNLINEHLSKFLGNPDVDYLLGIAYGEEFDNNLAKSLLKNQISEGFKDVKLDIINSDILGNANGVYGESINTILLADDFVKYSSNQLIAQVITEEFGHFLDSQINKIDSDGDEGNIFTNLVFNLPLNREKLNALKGENDQSIIELNGELVNIEKSEKSAFEVNNNLGEIISVKRDTSLLFQWTEREAEYDNELGLIVFDNPEGKIDGLSPQDNGYLEKLLTSSQREIIFAKGDGAGSWQQINFNEGDYFAFYLVQNNSSAEYLNNLSTNSNNINVFSSITKLNSDNFDHVFHKNIGEGIERFYWEDLTGGGDKDFDDVVLNIKEAGLIAPGEIIQTTPLNVTWSGDSSNEIGLILVDDANGSINGILPSDSDYLQSALGFDRHRTIFKPNSEINQNNREIPLLGQQYIGWYLISNGTRESLLTQNPNNEIGDKPVAYFSFPSANPNGLNHVYYDGTNKLVWEDLPIQKGLKVSQSDYQDAILTYQFGESITHVVSVETQNIQVNEPTNIPSVAEVKITLNQPHLLPLRVNYTTISDTAEENEDYQAISGSLEFAVGETEKWISIPILGDNLEEEDETFKLVISEAVNGVLGNSEVIITIIDSSSLIPLINNLPVTDADKTITLDEDSQPIALNINPPTDIDNDTLTITVTQLPDNSKGRITLNDGTIINVGDEISIESLTSLIYTPLADANGNGGDFVYTVNDGKGGSDSQTISFVINPENNPVNNPPVADADKTITLDEDSQPLGLNINSPTDIDNDTLTITITQLPDNSKGRITLNDGTIINVGDEISIESLTSLIYTPLADANGNGGSFVYTVNDGKGGSDSQTISFVINPENNPVNNPPVADADKTITLDEDSQPITLNINPPTDIDNDTLTITVTQLPDNSKGIITLNDGTIINVGDEISIASLTSLIYTPVTDANGNGGDFVYTVNDGKGGSDSQTISFVINPVAENNPPVADTDKTITLDEDSQPIDLNINPPTDIDNDTLTITVTQLPDNTKGRITLADGTMINVGDEISIASLTSLIYTPLADANGNGGSFVYTVNDGKGGSDSQTISFVINPENNPVNNPPVADADKTITLDEDSQPITLNINPPTDIDNDTLTITITQLPDNSKGRITLNDGTIINVGDEISIESLTSLIYTPVTDANGNGGDFVYTVNDGKGGSDSQTISFVINPSNLIVSAIAPNNAPEFTTNPELEIVAGNDYTYQANAVDADNDTLFYSLLLAPDDLTINNNTGVLTFESPTVGNYNISVLVEDGKGGKDTQNYNLTVLNSPPNRPPVFVSTPVVYGNLNTEYSYNANATDADNDTLTYSLINATEGLIINENTGVVTFTPTVLGETEITLQVDDGEGGIATQVYTLLVLEEETDNYAPVIISEPITQLFIDNTSSGFQNDEIFRVPGVIGETSPVTFDWIIRRAGFNNEFGIYRVDNNEGEISGLLPGDDGYSQLAIGNAITIFESGEGEGAITEVDLEAGALYSFYIIQNNNSDNFLNNNPNNDLSSGPLAFFSLTEANPDDNFDHLRSVFDETLGETVFYWEDLTFGGDQSFLDVVFTVDLLLEPSGDILYDYQVIATDPDNDSLTYNLEDAPLGATINAQTGLVEWIPASAEEGFYDFKVEVTDNNGGVDTQEFVVEVSNVPIEPIPNEAPIFTSPAPTTALVGELLTYQATATDANNDSLTYTLLNKPEGMTIERETGILTWQSKPSQIGTNLVVLRVSDGKGGLTTQEFTITTKGINTPPQIISSPNTAILVNNAYTYEVRATDFDNDTLTYSLINALEGMTINANTGIITYTPSELGTQTIEVQVSDGFGGTNTQTYQLQVLATLGNNQFPTITSTPQVIIGAGGLYEYEVNATDPESTVITYDLTTNPNDMVIDANTGLITWQTQNTTNGDFQVTVTATDADGGIAYQNYYIRVAPNQAPVITSQPLEIAQFGFTYEYDVIAEDGEGDRLSYRLTQATEGLTIDEFGRIRWQSNTQIEGVYPVTVEVNDGRGGIVTQTYNLTITDDDTTNPVVDLDFTDNVINIGETINLQVQATDNVGVETLTLTANGTPLTLNPNIPNDETNNAIFSSQRAGLYRIIATATDETGNIGIEEIEIRVVDPSDTEAPVVEINKTNLEATQGIIKAPTDIIATITDSNLESYRVEIAPVDAINLNNIKENDPDYILLSEGDTNITNQTVATLDPRFFANGSYLMRIITVDLSGNENVEGMVLSVTGQIKPGEFSLEYNDLFLPVTGIPIEINRRYNSLESGTVGDFGYGWDLGLKDANIVETAPDGRDLTNSSETFSIGTRVTLNTPDGRRVGFTFNPVYAGSIFLFGSVYAPSFTSDAGVYERLEVEYEDLSINSDGTVGSSFFGIDLFGYNPSQYKLITKDGTIYRYDQSFGLIDVTDRNGNKLTFSNDGIVSSTGAEVDFIRDNQGRITEIVDPDGKSIKYSYDSNGDLIEVVDRTNNTTELVYDDLNRPHFLTEIIDPLGRSASRTEYDDNGQISKIIDANGNELNIAFDNATNSQTIRDPFGNTITRVFDAQGNVIQEVDQLGGITLRTHDANNNLTSETDPEGNTMSYTYDDQGNKLTETDGEGNEKIFTYNENNDILTETDALGNVTTYTYDDSGNLTEREDAEGNVTTYEYDSLGLLTLVTDPNEKITAFEYNSSGNITELTDPTGAKIIFTYDSNGRIASLTDANGATVNYVYDSEGRLIEQIDPNANNSEERGITKIEYNAAGEKVAEIDALGRRTEYRYNDRGLLIETILPDSTPDDLTNNPRTLNEYDALDRLTGFTDELGRKTIYVYDALGREIEVIYPDSTPNNLTDNPRTKKEYDKAGLVIAEIDELGNRTAYEYDQADRLTKVTNALNQVTSYTFDADGRQVAMTDGLGRITEYDYDDLDRLLTTTFANDSVMTTTYDPLGRVIAETDLAGNTTNYEYDALGRLTAVIDALNQRTEYTYDLVGNLIEQKDANGNITQFEYDSLRRLQATILPDGQRNETIHDKIGNLIEVTDFNGVVTTYEYNERNWLTEKSFSDTTPKETFTYTLTGELATVTDNRGVTSYVYDERDRLISRTEPDNRTISYTYDKASNILVLTVPSGTTNYTYDALNRIDTVKDADNGVTDYDYDAVGNLVKTIFPNSVIENQEYDLLNRLTYLENRNNSGIISSYTYTLDAIGNRTKVVENDGRTVEYDYDNLYRLTEEKITDAIAGNKTIIYTFDAVGNRLQKVDSVEGTTTYTYDDNDRLLQETLGGNVTQYQYDDEGNLTAKVENGTTTASYEWNAKGELTAVEVTENGETGRIEFEYDHNGIRVAINVDGEETRFLIDNNQQQYAQVIEEYQPNGTVNTTYTHGWDLISQDDGTNRIYYQVDGLVALV